MGIFSDITDTLFGGTDDSAQKKQLKQNDRAQQFIEEATAQARGDALSLQPIVDQSLFGGYQSAADMLGGAFGSQLDTFGRGNYLAQTNLLAGMPQYQNAILGLPVDNSAIQPAGFNPKPSLDFMINPQMPDLGVPTDYSKFLSGNTPEGKYANSITPGMTNRQAVELAYAQGLLDDPTYQMYQTHFRNSGMGDKTGWGHAGSAANMLAGIGPNASPEWRNARTTLANLMYPV